LFRYLNLEANSFSKDELAPLNPTVESAFYFRPLPSVGD
jgi:hypothetical protein